MDRGIAQARRGEGMNLRDEVAEDKGSRGGQAVLAVDEHAAVVPPGVADELVCTCPHNVRTQSMLTCR